MGGSGDDGANINALASSMPVSSPPQLGLVCITVSKDIRYRTVTRKRLLEQSDDGQRKLLDDIYRDNLQTLDGALQYCRRNGIRLYRMPSSIFPFFDEDIGRAVMQPLAPALARTGRRATELGLRLVMHPDQFVVLSSDSPDVVANSVKILQMHADIMDLLEQPRSPWALLEIHGGKANRSDALVERIRALPDAIRLRLCLENDEYSYGADEIHDVCMRAGVPMVFDAHHHIVHDKLQLRRPERGRDARRGARDVARAGAPGRPHLERPRRVQRSPAFGPDHDDAGIRRGAVDRDRGEVEGRGDRWITGLAPTRRPREGGV